MNLVDLYRAFTSTRTGACEHAPRITQDLTRIVGCTCGWRTPTGAADSDDTYAAHIAIEGAGG